MPSPDRTWYRSLYWRIAVGFIALLAVLLLVQALMFLWLTGRILGSPSTRTPQQLADHVAREISEELAANPQADLDQFVRQEFGESYRPFVVLMRDGRRITNRPGALPRGFPGPGRGRQPGAGVEIEDRQEPRGGQSGPGARGRGTGRGRGARLQESAPIVVDGVQVGTVAVPPSPPAFVALQEFGPTLAGVGLALLAAGAVAAALVIFRPARKRLQSLEHAARALGEGRTDVRAPEGGGDEVSSLARAFNRMAADLESRAAALAASDEARRQLLADVSHELMTPLTAIRGYVQTLAMPEVRIDEATRRRYLDIADQETHKLEAIVGDLLDLARLEGGGGSLTLEDVPVGTLFGRVIDRHEPAVRTRGITIRPAIEPPALSVRADAQRLEQALQNLAANAVRHTPDHGCIELGAAREAGSVVLRVRDTGPGIPPDHLPRIFDRFYKADASRAAAAGGSGGPAGSGLGLSIVKAIAERHGGTVTARNAPEGGAVFELRLPGVAGDAAAEGGRPETTSG